MLDRSEGEKYFRQKPWGVGSAWHVREARGGPVCLEQKTGGAGPIVVLSPATTWESLWKLGCPSVDCGGGGWVFLIQPELRNTVRSPLSLKDSVMFTMRWGSHWRVLRNDLADLGFITLKRCIIKISTRTIK